MDTLKAAVILLVEDDPADQKLIKMSLNRQKIINDVHIASTAEKALAYLQRSKNGDPETPMPDLILLDLNMPGMGGKEFLEWLKSNNEFDAIPVVVLTTSDAEEDILDSYKLQASGYVKKPIGLQEFQRVFENLTDYWFVICKKVPQGSEHTKSECLIR